VAAHRLPQHPSTARPLAMASATTLPKVSVRLGKTKTSALA
jgi:hypothetical protein